MSRHHTLVFYDGNCGLCHGAVRFALGRDPEGRLFRFAPIQGSALAESLSRARARAVAETDSLAVLCTDDTLRERSDAVLFLLSEIGGGWRLVARSLAIIPGGVLDLVYRAVARVRHRLFGRPAGLCPVVPPSLRDRFLP